MSCEQIYFESIANKNKTHFTILSTLKQAMDSTNLSTNDRVFFLAEDHILQTSRNP